MRDLARIAAERAAGAFSSLLGASYGLGESQAEGEPGFAVLCDVQGGMEGVIVLILPLRVRDRVVSTLCPGADPEGERAASALREVGNIVASQAVSAIADRLGVRITLSVPKLIADISGVSVERMVAERGNGAVGFASESELAGNTGARLLMAGRASPKRV